MTQILDANPNSLISALAKELEAVEQVQAPDWAKFVKTGAHNERPPTQTNWWFIRSAAILRTIFKDGPVGVGKLRSKYGGAKNRGSRPERFKKGSGNIIRKILQQLQTAEFIKMQDKEVHKGRVIAPKGQALLQKVANKVGIGKPQPKIAPKVVKVAPKVEEKPKTEAPKAAEKPKAEKPAAPAKAEKSAAPIATEAKPIKAAKK